MGCGGHVPVAVVLPGYAKQECIVNSNLAQ